MNKGRTVLNCDNTLSQKSLKSSRRFYSVCTNLSKEYTTPEICPLFITGFFDAVGCFVIIVRKAPKNNLG